jgi:hypothetical protein
MSPSTSDARPGGDLFAPHVARTGVLGIRWTPTPGARNVRIWVLLAAPHLLSAEDLSPERLLPRLIRIPVAAMASEARVHVPVGRPLGVAIVGESDDGSPIPMLPSACVDLPLEIDGGSNPAPPPEPPPATTVPAAAPPVVTPAVTRAVAPAPTTPSLSVLSETASEAVCALARRLSAQLPIQPPAPVSPGGFGMTQPFYLGRISFAPGTPHAPRVLVHRQTFIDPASLAAWRAGPPDDAVPLPDACDGAIDALTSEGRTSFFALLQGPEPWEALPLTPSSPPFEEIRHPIVLGDPTAPLAALTARAAASSGALRELLQASIDGLQRGL